MVRFLIALSVLTVLLAGSAVYAALDNDAGWWTVDAGGASWAELGDYRLGATVGQPDAATVGAGWYELQGGYWPGARVVHPVVYVPVLSSLVGIETRITYGQISICVLLLALALILRRVSMDWMKAKCKR